MLVTPLPNVRLPSNAHTCGHSPDDVVAGPAVEIGEPAFGPRLGPAQRGPTCCWWSGRIPNALLESATSTAGLGAAPAGSG